MHSPSETSCRAVAARGTSIIIVVVVVCVSLFLFVGTLEELFEGGRHFIILCTGRHDCCDCIWWRDARSRSLGAQFDYYYVGRNLCRWWVVDKCLYRDAALAIKST